LGQIGDGRAIVIAIVNAIAVNVGIAGIAFTIIVRVRLGRIGEGRAIVKGIANAIAVMVAIAGIADTIPVTVGLRGVDDERAIIHAVVDPVTIEISVCVTGVAYVVTIGVHLGRIGHPKTIVGRVVEPVAVSIGVTDVTYAVTIEIDLIYIGQCGAIVGSIRDTILVEIGRLGQGFQRRHQEKGQACDQHQDASDSACDAAGRLPHISVPRQKNRVTIDIDDPKLRRQPLVPICGIRRDAGRHSARAEIPAAGTVGNQRKWWE
jgi:hypothetical protein